MRELVGCALLLLIGCTVDLQVPNGIAVSCTAQADCPSPLVCVRSLGQCVSPDTACVERDGDEYIAAQDGNVCTSNGATGICGGGACIICGDGGTGAGEECDDGNSDNTDACTNDCHEARCGDGFVQAGEACDDGNAVDTDGCLTTCVVATCGDGFVSEGVEPCDDGNNNPNDGCTSCVLTTWTPQRVGGTPPPGFADNGFAVDSDGIMYFVDTENRHIWRRDGNGGLSVFAGNDYGEPPRDGAAAADVALNAPYDVAVSASGDVYISTSVYAVSEVFVNQILRVDQLGIVHIVMQSPTSNCDLEDPTSCNIPGPANQASLYTRPFLAVDRSGNLLLADYTVLERIDHVTGIIERIAGSGATCTNYSTTTCGEDGAATAATFSFITGITVDGENAIYISDGFVPRVLRIDPNTGVVTRVAGTGATCAYPLAADAALCGEGGDPRSAKLSMPTGLAFGNDGSLYIAQSPGTQGVRIHRVSPDRTAIVNYAGSGNSCGDARCDNMSCSDNYCGNNGPAASAALTTVFDLAFAPDGSLLLDGPRRITLTDDIIHDVPVDWYESSTVVGQLGTSFDSVVHNLTLDANGRVIFYDDYYLYRWTPQTGVFELLSDIDAASDIAVTPDGALYLALKLTGSGSLIVRVEADGTQTLVAGLTSACSDNDCGDGGPATSATFVGPLSLAAHGATLFIADAGNSSVRKLEDGVVSLVAGNYVYGDSGDGGVPTSAELACPRDIAVDSSGTMYVADFDSGRVRRISGDIIDTVVVGTSAATPLSRCAPVFETGLMLPKNIWVDSHDTLYFDDLGTNSVYRHDAASNVVVVGNGTAGYDGDGGPATAARHKLGTDTYASYGGIAVDGSGVMYVIGRGILLGDGLFVRRIDTTGVISTVIGDVDCTREKMITGPALSSRLVSPGEMTVVGETVLVTESARVKRITPATSRLDVVAGYTNGYVAEDDKGIVSSVAARLARYTGQLTDIVGIVADQASSRVFVSNADRIGIMTTSGDPSTWTLDMYGAGSGYLDGALSIARFDDIAALAYDAAAHTLYVADSGNSIIRAVTVDADPPVVSTIAGVPRSAGFSGDGGSATSALLDTPSGVAVRADGIVYIADTMNNRIRKVEGGVITTVYGNGSSGVASGSLASQLPLAAPKHLAFDSYGTLLIGAGTTVQGLVDDDRAITVYSASSEQPFPGNTLTCIGAVTPGWLDNELFINDTCQGLVVKLTRDQGS